MKRILEGSSRRVDTIFDEVDTNFIEVCNCIMRIIYPEYNLLGYVSDAEPEDPDSGDCYLVGADATMWEIELEKNEIVHWNGSAWEILAYKITEINEALQTVYFNASKIAIVPVEGLAAVNVQQAIAELTAAMVAGGLIVLDASGSGSGV